MSTILIGWELGGGLGHVPKLLDVANELAARGHRPVLAVKDLAVTRHFLRDVSFPVVQAPIFRDQVPPSFRALSFADILAISGFGDADGLLLLVNAWQSLIEMTGARLVVCNFAPSLCLAAYGVLPTVVVGTGFTVPPVDGHEFPRLGPRFGTIVSADQVLENVQRVQKRRGRPAPEALPAMMASAARFVHTIAEIDAYRATRSGVVEPLRTPEPPLCAAAAGSFFAYLSAANHRVDLILPELAAAGSQGAAYVRHASPHLVAAARKAGITMHDEPPPLKEALTKAAVLIHHGGLNSTEIALAAGRPQLTLPNHLEHDLTAKALEDLGVGRSLKRPHRPREVVELLQEISAPGGCSRQAVTFAHEIQARNYQGCLPQIADYCQAQLV